MRIRLQHPDVNTRTDIVMRADQKDLFWAYIKAASPLTDSQSLSVLSFSEWTPIRRRVAGNYNTPQNILELLSLDSACEVRAAVACNPSCPRGLVEKLVRDFEPEVRLEIAKNAEAPEFALHILANDSHPLVRSAAKVTLRMWHAPGLEAPVEPRLELLPPVYLLEQTLPISDLPIRNG